jgi:bacterioferritin-associated ferredoxin
MYVCICNAVTDTDINREIDAGAVTLEQLRAKLNVASSCGRCSVTVIERLHARLEHALSQMEPPIAHAS